MAERARDWMAQAERDLAHAENDLASGFYEWSCFSAQQTVEKAIKALYQTRNQLAWGHSVRELLEGLRDELSVSESLIEVGKSLDKYYILSLYPNGFPSGAPVDYFTERDAQGAVDAAHKIIRFCKDHLA